jgi:hypothetical protein
MANLAPHRARRDAATYALELLAEESSATFDRSVVCALFRIGWRDRAEADAAEWALLHLAELLLALREQRAAEVAP